jgi:hypothetical protein
MPNWLSALTESSFRSPINERFFLYHLGSAPCLLWRKRKTSHEDQIHYLFLFRVWPMLNELQEVLSGMRESLVLIREASRGEQRQLTWRCTPLSIIQSSLSHTGRAPWLCSVSSSIGCPTLNHFKSSFPWGLVKGSLRNQRVSIRVASWHGKTEKKLN